MNHKVSFKITKQIYVDSYWDNFFFQIRQEYFLIFLAMIVVSVSLCIVVVFPKLITLYFVVLFGVPLVWAANIIGVLRKHAKRIDTSESTDVSYEFLTDHLSVRSINGYSEIPWKRVEVLLNSKKYFILRVESAWLVIPQSEISTDTVNYVLSLVPKPPPKKWYQ